MGAALSSTHSSRWSVRQPRVSIGGSGPSGPSFQLRFFALRQGDTAPLGGYLGVSSATTPVTRGELLDGPTEHERRLYETPERRRPGRRGRGGVSNRSATSCPGPLPDALAVALGETLALHSWRLHNSSPTVQIGRRRGGEASPRRFARRATDPVAL